MQYGLRVGAAPDLVTLSLTSLTPKKYTYWISRLCWSSQWQEALSLAKHARLAGKANVVDVRSCGAELLACSKGAMWTTSLFIMEEMQVARLEMNSIIWSEILASMASARRWRQALLLLSEVEQHNVRDATMVLYNSAIKAMGSQWSQAFQILHRARQRQLQPTVITLNSLLAACSLAACWEEAIHVFSIRRIATSDLISLNTAMAACRNAGHWDVALRLLRSHAGGSKALRGVRADVVTFNTAMSACANGQRWEMTLALLRRAVRQDIQPNISSFNTAMTACVQAHRWPLAIILFAQLQRNDCQGDIITFTTLLSAMESASRWQQALQLYFHQLPASGLKANAIANNCLLATCAAAQQWEMLIELAVGRDQLQPKDPLTYEILGQMLRRVSHEGPMLMFPHYVECPHAIAGKGAHCFNPVKRRNAVATAHLRRSLPFQTKSVRIAASKIRTELTSFSDVLVSVVQNSMLAGMTWDVSPTLLLEAASLPAAEMRRVLNAVNLSQRRCALSLLAKRGASHAL